MRVVEARVAILDPSEDLLAQLVGRAIDRGPAPITMHQALHPMLLETSQETPSMTGADPQSGGGLLEGQLAFQDTAEYRYRVNSLLLIAILSITDRIARQLTRTQSLG